MTVNGSFIVIVFARDCKSGVGGCVPVNADCLCICGCDHRLTVDVCSWGRNSSLVVCWAHCPA